MNRRSFVAGFGKLSLLGSTAAVAAVPVIKGKEAVEQSVDAVNDQIKALKDKVDNMEKDQKKLMKVILGVGALSLGMDLSIIL